jgi:hypothetical protein
VTCEETADRRWNRAGLVAIEFAVGFGCAAEGDDREFAALKSLVAVKPASYCMQSYKFLSKGSHFVRV